MHDPEGIKKLRKQAATGARWMGVATATRVSTQFVQLAVLARLLTPDAFGLMAMIYVVIVVGQAFADAGLSNSIVHYQDAAGDELSSLYWLNLFAGLVVFGLVLSSAPLVARIYDEPQLRDLVGRAALVFLITPWGQQFQVLLERDLRFRRVALVEMVATICGAAVGIFLASRGFGVLSLIYAMLSQAAVKAALLLANGLPRWRPAFRFRWSSCRRFVRFGAFQMGERAINVLGQQLDKLLIGILMGPTLLGYYYLAYNFVMRPYQIINPVFTRVAFPVFSKVQKDADRLKKGFLEVIEVVGMIMAPLYALIIALAVPIVGIQYGEGYEPIIPLLKVLALLGLFFAVGNPLGSVLLAKGRADVAFYLNVMRIILFTAAVLIGGRIGLSAIAWSLVIVMAGIVIPFGFWVRWWLMEMRPLEYLRVLGPFVVVAGLTGVGVYLLSSRIPWPNAVVNLLVSLAAAACVYLGVLAAWQRPRLRRLWTLVRT